MKKTTNTSSYSHEKENLYVSKQYWQLAMRISYKNNKSNEKLTRQIFTGSQPKKKRRKSSAHHRFYVQKVPTLHGSLH